ncbi:hypothetical protein PQR64_33895 [Paraburkholderia phytofirmans]|uniref:DUF4376 domain-containing protein n=1 Tax=Paraburkholderia phytofirmans TaxID=261302 RepID=UPI0038B84DB1
MGQKYAAYDANGNITAFYDSIDSPVPAEVANVLKLTDAQWQACINEPGKWCAPAGVLTAVPAPSVAQQLASAQAAQIAALSASCAAAIVAGFTSTALGSVYTYPSKLTDQQNLSASVLASLMPGLPANWMTPFWCEDAGGNWSFVSHTAQQIQRVGQDGKEAILACIEKNQTLVEEAKKATSIEDVLAVDWT